MRNRKYFNSGQLIAMSVQAKYEYIIAPRGYGKSEGFDAPRLIRNVHAMPGSSGAILSPTYTKLLRNTLPPIVHSLERLGYKRNVHFFIGQKPPKNMQFKKPVIDPIDYSYTMAWYNGSIQHLLSFDRQMSANSMSLDYLLGPEAKFLDIDKIHNEVIPAVRGFNKDFADCPWYHGESYTSDMPLQKMGFWLFEKEKEMDKDLIDLIKLVYMQYKELTKQKDSPYKIGRLKRITKELNMLRSKATFYFEPHILDNIAILGEEFIAKAYRDLPKLIFRTAIGNQRLKKNANGFYAALNEKVHYYESFNNGFVESLQYDFEKIKNVDSRQDGDLDPSLPLSIALDYNSSINNIVVGQRHASIRQLRTVNSMFVKTPDKIKEVCDKFGEYYKYFLNRNIIYYFDSTAIHSDAKSAERFMDVVIKSLQLNGFVVHPRYIGNPPKHNQKHMWFDMAFKGDPGYLFPVFNKHNNEYLLAAMELAGVKIGRNGFVKDKSEEKEEDSTESPDELKTHVTDAWDTLYIGNNFYPYNVDTDVSPANNY